MTPILCSVLSVLAAAFLLPATAVLAASDYRADCDIQQGPCSKKASGGIVNLEVTPRPVKMMKELNLTILYHSKDSPEKLIVDLTMPGMFMGKNQAVLKRVASGTFTGKGVLPHCPSGRTLWRASVLLSSSESVDFLFNAVP